MRLNLGCGVNAKEEYVNVDVQSFEGVDIQGDIRKLEFPDKSIQEILAEDLIEHLTYVEGKMVLQKCYRWLEQYGSINLHTVNLKFIVENLTKIASSNRRVEMGLTRSYEWELMQWMFGSDGGQEWMGRGVHPAGFHKWLYSIKSLTELLVNIGFTIIKSEESCGGFGLRIIATKK